MKSKFSIGFIGVLSLVLVLRTTGADKPQKADAVIHIDETRAVEPLERTSVWDKGELPETYPFKV